MLFNRDELLLLSRGGRVPRAQRPRPGPVDVGPVRRRPTSRPRWLSLRGRGGEPRPRRGELNPHAYLELELVVDDEL
ncbi:MAG: hypothetical protein ACR2NR_06780 [Solirubrobacteraceae bacterium]